MKLLNRKKRRFDQNRHREIKEVMDIIETGITKVDLATELQLQADSLKRGTYGLILNQDEEFKKQQNQYAELYKKFEKMELSKQLSDTIYKLFEIRSDMEFAEVAMSYRAGMIDSYRILKYMGLTRE